MEYKPQFDNVLIEEKDIRDQTNFVFPEDNIKRYKTGIILEVGNGSVNDGNTLISDLFEKGQEVIFKDNSSVVISLDSKNKYYIVKAEDILVIIEE